MFLGKLIFPGKKVSLNKVFLFIHSCRQSFWELWSFRQETNLHRQKSFPQKGFWKTGNRETSFPATDVPQFTTVFKSSFSQIDLQWEGKEWADTEENLDLHAMIWNILARQGNCPEFRNNFRTSLFFRDENKQMMKRKQFCRLQKKYVRFRCRHRWSLWHEETGMVKSQYSLCIDFYEDRSILDFITFWKGEAAGNDVFTIGAVNPFLLHNLVDLFPGLVAIYWYISLIKARTLLR